MLSAFLKAIAQLNDRRVRRVVWISLLAAMAVFALLLGAIAALLGGTVLLGIGWLETLIDVLGGLAALVLTWILFPAVVSLIMPFFLDEVAAAVEGRHYPGLPPARSQPLDEALVLAARLAGLLVALNLLALPIYIFFPAVNLIVYYGLNGYLISREYFELVAYRRLEGPQAARLRRRVQVPLLAAGAGLAFLLTVPVVNLVAPVVGTAAMVHLFEGWRRKYDLMPGLNQTISKR